MKYLYSYSLNIYVLLYIYMSSILYALCIYSTIIRTIHVWLYHMCIYEWQLHKCNTHVEYKYIYGTEQMHPHNHFIHCTSQHIFAFSCTTRVAILSWLMEIVVLCTYQITVNNTRMNQHANSYLYTHAYNYSVYKNMFPSWHQINLGYVAMCM